MEGQISGQCTAIRAMLSIRVGNRSPLSLDASVVVLWQAGRDGQGRKVFIKELAGFSLAEWVTNIKRPIALIV